MESGEGRCSSTVTDPAVASRRSASSSAKWPGTFVSEPLKLHTSPAGIHDVVG